MDAFELMKQAIALKPEDANLQNRLNEIHQATLTDNGEPIKVGWRRIENLLLIWFFCSVKE